MTNHTLDGLCHTTSKSWWQIWRSRSCNSVRFRSDCFVMSSCVMSIIPYWFDQVVEIRAMFFWFMKMIKDLVKIIVFPSWGVICRRWSCNLVRFRSDCFVMWSCTVSIIPYWFDQVVEIRAIFWWFMKMIKDLVKIIAFLSSWGIICRRWSEGHECIITVDCRKIIMRSLQQTN
jgi:hypothetical protein